MPVAAVAKTRRPARARARLEPVRDAERTKRALLDAAEIEFADKGLAGARVDVIAAEASANKRMLYYYFGSKDDLYVAVLERAYCAMRERETKLKLNNMDPVEAIKRLVEFKCDYYVENPRIISLLAAENMNGG